MLSDANFRRILWLSALTNLGGALLFALPAWPLGQLAGLPADVPLFYRAFVALFVLIYAGMYAWLAMQPVIHRPMVVLAAIGKSSAFLLVLLLWLMGAASVMSLALLSADLALAALYLAWLRRSR
ncbi:MAG: hypothetical protein V4709_12225 [Pseudomonadota bacterium]